jgi:hypothetical protein
MSALDGDQANTTGLTWICISDNSTFPSCETMSQLTRPQTADRLDLGHFDLPRSIHQHLDRPPRSWPVSLNLAAQAAKSLTEVALHHIRQAHRARLRPTSQRSEQNTLPSSRLTVFTCNACVRRTLSARGLMSSMLDDMSESFEKQLSEEGKPKYPVQRFCPPTYLAQMGLGSALW